MAGLRSAPTPKKVHEIWSTTSSPPPKKEKHSKSLVPELLLLNMDADVKVCHKCSITFTDDTTLETHRKKHQQFKGSIPLTPESKPQEVDIEHSTLIQNHRNKNE